MFDPEDFARLAARLVVNPCGAADARTAISRTYYSSFLLAQRFLDPHFYWSKGAEVHEQIYMLFVNSKSQELQVIARKLSELRGKRNDADYDTSAVDVDSYHDARLHNASGIRINEALKKLFASKADSEQALVGMKKWAKISRKVRAK